MPFAARLRGPIASCPVIPCVALLSQLVMVATALAGSSPYQGNGTIYFCSSGWSGGVTYFSDIFDAGKTTQLALEQAFDAYLKQKYGFSGASVICIRNIDVAAANEMKKDKLIGASNSTGTQAIETGWKYSAAAAPPPSNEKPGFKPEQFAGTYEGTYHCPITSKKFTMTLKAAPTGDPKIKQLDGSIRFDATVDGASQPVSFAVSGTITFLQVILTHGNWETAQPPPHRVQVGESVGNDNAKFGMHGFYDPPSGTFTGNADGGMEPNHVCTLEMKRTGGAPAAAATPSSAPAAASSTAPAVSNPAPSAPAPKPAQAPTPAPASTPHPAAAVPAATHPSAAPAASPSAAATSNVSRAQELARPTARLDVEGVYHGTYTCAEVAQPFQITFVPTGPNNVRAFATLHFGAGATPNVATIRLRGNYYREIQEFEIVPAQWETQSPPSFTTLRLKGKLDTASGKLTGRVVQPLGCQTFTATRNAAESAKMTDTVAQQLAVGPAVH